VAASASGHIDQAAHKIPRGLSRHSAAVVSAKTDDGEGLASAKQAADRETNATLNYSRRSGSPVIGTPFHVQLGRGAGPVEYDT
jgi:hypothetical protein